MRLTTATATLATSQDTGAVKKGGSSTLTRGTGSTALQVGNSIAPITFVTAPKLQGVIITIFVAAGTTCLITSGISTCMPVLISRRISRKDIFFVITGLAGTLGIRVCPASPMPPGRTGARITIVAI